MTSPMFELPEEQPRPPRRRSEQQESQAFVDQMMYLLTAPHIGWPGWEDQVRRQKENITLYRLAHGREIFEQQMCTEFEAMMYVSTVSLAHPINQHWAEIYGWLFTRWKPEEGKEIWGEHLELYHSQVEDLNRLRRWIYRQQVNHLKAKRRSAQGEEAATEDKEPEVQQPMMFDLTETEEE